MSQRIDSIHRPIPQDENQSVFPGKAAALATVLAAIVFVFAAVAVVGPRSNPAIETTEVASLAATNPELRAVGRYARETAKTSEAAFLSANPELIATRRHAEVAAKRAEDSLLATNPELMAVRHYSATEARTLGTTLDPVPAPQILVPKAAYADSDEAPALAANPELVVFQHFISKDSLD